MARPNATLEGTSDAGLIAASSEEPSAFGVLFDRHADPIRAYFVRRVGTSLADELTAETFTRAFEQRARYEPLYGDARPWLYGIATNLIYKVGRAERRQLIAYGKAAAMPAGGVDDFADADDRVDAERAGRELAAALPKLNPGDRDALLLFAWEQLSYDDVAAALGIPVGTVASRINRARRVLRSASGIGDPQSKGDL